jgi:hypothetical protein
MVGGVTMTVTAQTVQSPNGKLTAEVKDNQLTISYNGQQALEMTVQGVSGQPVKSKGTVKADYQMLTGKRRHCTNVANEYQLGNVTLRMYNDGIALRTSALSPQTSAL